MNRLKTFLKVEAEILKSEIEKIKNRLPTIDESTPEYLFLTKHLEGLETCLRIIDK